MSELLHWFIVGFAFGLGFHLAGAVYDAVASVISRRPKPPA